LNVNPTTILGIESSCDDTSAAIIKDGKILANIVACQEVHHDFGGVVPELASRAHQQNIVPVVHQAIKLANIENNELSAIAFTRGPGLLGSLLVGSSFAKGMALGLDIPLIEINHMQAHVLSHFIEREEAQLSDDESTSTPNFPFLCLTVSGGHTQIVLVKDHFDMEVIGQTTDDAVGEAFDKAAKVMGLPYPGGPVIDKLAQEGNREAYAFPHPKIDGYNYSFSGLKTAFLYFIQDHLKSDSNFIEKNKADICASYQAVLIDVLLGKLTKASADLDIKEIAIAGGVAANSRLRNQLSQKQMTNNWNVYIPPFEYCTDNAAMIACAGYFKYMKCEFAEHNISSEARYVL